MGFNMELPPPIFDKKEDKMDKLAFYKRADADSIRRRELLQQDPYHRRANVPVSLTPSKSVADAQADALLRQLDLLQRKIEQPEVAKPTVKRKAPRHREMQEPTIPDRQLIPDPPGRAPDTGMMHTDPELDRLNEMLDKIAKLQKGEQDEGEKPMPSIDTRANSGVKQDQFNQTISVTVPAVVESDQEMVNGATVALRLTAHILFNGISIPKGQLMYGIVTLNNDRMQVTIRSIRCGQSILSTAWQLYDMDGLPGIHIPDGLGRQVARQSADQSIGSLNLSTYDPSIGAQVTGAGIQAARNLLSRKVRTIRVTVPAGYQVLLRDTKAAGSSLRVIQDTTTGRTGDSLEVSVQPIVPPAIDSLHSFLHETVTESKVSLTLRGIYQREGMVWLYLVVRNRGSMDFYPDQLHISVAQGRHLKRMAIQELPVHPLYDSLPFVVKSGDEQPTMVGMKPFMMGKDKKLVIRLVEKNAISELDLKVPHKSWAKVK